MSGHDLFARPEDGKAILRILESAPAKGGIELLYTRRPDAYASYQKEFGESRIFVSRDKERVIGTCAELVREVYLGGKPAKVAYLCGLKKDADYEGNVGFGLGFIRALVRENIDCYFCSVVSDNRQAQEMFGKGSRVLHMQEMQDYTTYILKPRVSVKAELCDCHFRQATKADERGIVAFYEQEGRKKDLFPVITSTEQFYGLATEDFYLLEKDGKIVAAAALWNQTVYKQYVVKKYSGIMKFARLLNPILSMLGYIKLPKENQGMDFPMLSFFLSSDDNKTYYKAFLEYIQREIAKKYDMYVIGIPKNHFAAELFGKMRSIHFDTKLYSVRFLQKVVKEIDKERLYPECGLL